MALEFQTNVASLAAQKNLTTARSARRPASTASRAASVSTPRPTTRPASRSATACSARSARTPSLSATPNDGISMAQTAEGALGQVTDILSRMRELAVQSSNGSLQSDATAATSTRSSRSSQRKSTRIQESTKFNGKHAHAVGVGEHHAFQVGINNALERPDHGDVRRRDALTTLARRDARRSPARPPAARAPRSTRSTRRSRNGLDDARALRRGDEPPRDHARANIQTMRAQHLGRQLAHPRRGRGGGDSRAVAAARCLSQAGVVGPRAGEPVAAARPGLAPPVDHRSDS